MLYFCPNCGNKMDEYDFKEFCEKNEIYRDSEIICPLCENEMYTIDENEETDYEKYIW